MNGGRPTFRFAPSPNGELHLGHALSALENWRWAQRLDGRCLLRIEDIDTGRARAQFVEQIFDDLAWLGLTWEQPVRRQSGRFEFYRAAAVQLQQMGLLYPCFATRSEIKAAVAQLPEHPANPDGAPIYPKLHKQLGADEVAARKAAGQPFAMRLDMDRALAVAAETMGDGMRLTYRALDESGATRVVDAQPERWGDAVIVRKDVPASYHLAVVVDDAEQGVSHIVRGQDLEAATDLHCLLQILLGLPQPLYHHHRLVLDAGGRKLSKSDGATSLKALRARGISRADVLGLLEEA